MLSVLRIIFRKDTLFSKPLGVFPLELRRGAFISETSPTSSRQRCLEVRASMSLWFPLFTAVVFLRPPIFPVVSPSASFTEVVSLQISVFSKLIARRLHLHYVNLPSSALTTPSEGPHLPVVLIGPFPLDSAHGFFPLPTKQKQASKPTKNAPL